MFSKFFRYLHRKHVLWLFVLILFSAFGALGYMSYHFISVNINRPVPHINPKPDPKPKPPKPKPWSFALQASDVELAVQYQQGEYWFDESMLMYFVSKKLVKTILPDDICYASYLFNDCLKDTYAKKAEIIFYNDKNVLRKDIVLSLENRV